MTPAYFKGVKTQFAAVSDVTVQVYLDLAALMVGDDWPAAYRDAGKIAYTCHLMTLEGLGTDAESVAQSDGTVDIQEIKSGEVTLKKFADAYPGSDYSEWLRSTTCGKSFYFMAKGIRGGPRVVSPGISNVSGYAKDQIYGAPYGWPGVFGS